jgi:predicted transcriptional regulator
MTKVPLTVEVESELQAEIAAMASVLGMSVDQLLNQLMRDAVSRNGATVDQWIRTEIQRGIDEANEGLLIPAEQVEEEFAKRRAATGKTSSGA